MDHGSRGGSGMASLIGETGGAGKRHFEDGLENLASFGDPTRGSGGWRRRLSGRFHCSSSGGS